MLKSSPWFVYILQCADSTFYAGVTQDIPRRLYEHNHDNRLGARYTRPRRPCRVVWWEEQPDRSTATSREREIKRMTRPRKLKLMALRPSGSPPPSLPPRPDFKALVRDLRKRHDCHTILLHGSHARGEATTTSDLDIACVCETGEVTPDCRTWRGFELDARVCGEKVLTQPENFLHLADAVILYDQSGFGEALMASIKLALELPIQPLTREEKAHQESWARKALRRAEARDALGNFRALELAITLLEYYFTRRTMLYPGPKRALQTLQNENPDVFVLFEKSLSRPTELETLRQLVDQVLDRNPAVTK